MKRWLKYVAVAAASLRSQWAYPWERLLGNLLMLLILYSFTRLWIATLADSNRIEGYTLADLMWYMLVAEALQFSAPRISGRIDQEVRSGDLAYRLNKPANYLLWYGAEYLSDAAARLLTSLVLGGALVWWLVGPPPIPAVAVLPVALALLLSMAISFCLQAATGLLAFWTEDTAGIWLLVSRVQLILGGVLMPLEVFPRPLARIAAWLPFQYLSYGPARLAVRFAPAVALDLYWHQLLWLAVFAALLAALFARGLREVSVGGG